MKLIVRTIFLAFWITNSIVAQNQSRKSPSEIAREQSQAVAIVEAVDDRGIVIGQGSGFVVTPGGAIVSNLHVVRGAAMVRIRLPNGDMYKTADVVDVDDAKDIIVLKIKGFQLPTVRLGDSDRTEVGEPIVAISSPEGLPNTISTGVISGVRRLDTHRVFQITAPISNGSSGGALYDTSGAVIGIVTYVFKGGQNINFAVPINYVRGMIGDQATKNLAQIQAKPQTSTEQKEAAPTAPALGETREDSEQVDGQLTNAMRGRLGRTPQEPMFVRPDQALSFFYRLVDGIGIYTTREVGDLTRTAAVLKSKDSDSSEEYTIKHLSLYSGVAISFSKPDRLLESVELLVNWSEEELKNTFGGKFRRRTIGNRKVLDFGRLENGKQLMAEIDGNGNIRAVRFSKGK
jgi:S1-C subfamily serine protease